MAMPNKTVRVMPWEVSDAVNPMTLREEAKVAMSMPWEPSSFQRGVVRDMGKRVIELLDHLESLTGPQT